MPIELEAMDKHTVPYLDGCALSIVRQTTVNVIRNFCYDSQIWRHTLDPISLIANQAEYDLDDIPSYSEVLFPTQVFLHGGKLQPGEGYGFEPGCTQLVMLHTPQANDPNALVVQVSLRPRHNACRICERLYDDWYQTWAYGVFAELMAQPNRSWSSPQNAGFYQSKYMDGLRKAIVQSNRGHTNRAMQARPRWKFAGR